jgi:uncharacterized protein YdhG (YjbR/CyaY superfamily)
LKGPADFGYLPFLGLDVMRQVAADLVSRTSGQRYDWRTECVISAGGLSGILNVLLATPEPGAELHLNIAMTAAPKIPKTIDEYIAGFPPDVQAILQKMRETIRKAAPKAVEKISYQMPTFERHGNLVHFAAYKTHVGFYPTPSGIEKFKAEIADYGWAKGSVQFPLDKPVPYALVAKITKFRAKENLERAQSVAKKAAKKS